MDSLPQFGDTNRNAQESVTATELQSPSTTSPQESIRPEVEGAATSKVAEMEVSSNGAPANLHTGNVGTAGSRNEEWYNAIEGNDCKKLLDILRATPTEGGRKKLLAEEEEEGRNAMHVACMQGSFALVREIIRDSIENFEAYNSMYDRTGNDAFTMANLIGHASIEQYLLSFQSFASSEVMYPAYEDSEWDLALREGDCTGLQKLAQFNSRCVMEYASDSEKTVLDVAVEQDSMSLASVVMGLFDADQRIVWGKCYFPTELPWGALITRTNATRSRKFEGSLVWKELLKEKTEKRVASTLGTAAVPDSLDGVLDVARLKRDISAFVDQAWTEVHEAAYVADVDFNHEEDEDRLSLLRFHFLCKVRAPASFFEDGSSVMTQLHWEFIFKMRDAQGRTPFHNALTSSSSLFDIMGSPNLGRDFVQRAMIQPPDSRGRTSLMRAIMWEYLRGGYWLGNILVALGTNFRDSEVALLAFCLNKSMLDKIMSYKKDFLVEDAKHFVWRGVPFLSIVVGLSNPTILRMMLKSGVDPMGVDDRGQTTLHYAVNPRKLSFYLIKECLSSTDFMRMELEWERLREENESNESQRSCIQMLLQAGVDISQEDKFGHIPDVGESTDAEFHRWWYETSLKDTLDKKSDFNAAGNALSVVGTLVAATSYVGPLQPPMGLNNDGYASTNNVLLRMFVVTNTLAFYLAIASVMFAVVPSLPMPQEGMIEELRRARHTIVFCLCLLLSSIVCIILSFASATAAVMDSDDRLEFYSLLLSPSIIGWLFCLIAIGSFFVRLLRLVFYRNSVVRGMYKFSMTKYCAHTWQMLRRLTKA